MPERNYRALLWTLALLGLGLDQASKYGVFAWLKGVESHAYAVFQTEPASRALQAMPFDPVEQQHWRGFFLEVAFQHGAEGEMTPHVNHGALFGLFRDHKTYANLGFALISLLAALGIVAWSWHQGTARDAWLMASLGLILAGTLGNLYDRLLFNGVRDFLHWNYLFDWPVFNIADCCLVAGAAMLVLQAFLMPQSAGGKKEEPKVLATTGNATGAQV